MGYILYAFSFLVSLIIIFIGLYKSDNEIIQSGASLFLFMLAAFIGTLISEIKKKKIDTRVLKIIIPLFLISIACIICGAYTDHLILGSFISLLLGIISCSYITFQRSVSK